MTTNREERKLAVLLAGLIALVAAGTFHVMAEPAGYNQQLTPATAGYWVNTTNR